MKKIKVKESLFNERKAGTTVFEILGKKISYRGILERVAIDNTYVPKLYAHEKSNWCLVLVHPWMNRHTLYYGNYMRTEPEAREFLAGVQHRIQLGVSVDEIVQKNFQDAFMYMD